jgi:hypothetical protein
MLVGVRLTIRHVGRIILFVAAIFVPFPKKMPFLGTFNSRKKHSASE